jgi:enoyl-CoA hydratase/carnithine racemase
VPPTELEQLLAAIDAQPIAATVLCQLLRQTLTLTVSQALKNESLAYSVLQSSAGFNNWLANRAEAPLCDDQTPSVIVERQEQLLEISLNRPQRHNAYNAQMRDELCAALQIAATDQTIKQIRLLGNGPSFCSGGDLAEFGSVTDSGVAHIVRTSRSPGLLLSQLASRVSVHLHGACIGAGIELPSFCSHVSAQRDAYFRLPEVALGLIPGAGGTVSISRRIGRQATAKLALTGATIRAQEALDLGLIDAIDHD